MDNDADWDMRTLVAIDCVRDVGADVQLIADKQLVETKVGFHTAFLPPLFETNSWLVSAMRTHNLLLQKAGLVFATGRLLQPKGYLLDAGTQFAACVQLMSTIGWQA